MKLREKFRRFWTMDVHNHEGFTLVELIIVIAILAILSSVAVVGYSSYVEKANKQADATLVAEIKNALNLAMYSDPFTDPAVGVLVLSQGEITLNGEAIAERSEVDKALIAAFGANYKETLKLKYADWEVSSYLNGLNSADAEIFLESSYLSGGRADMLLGDVEMFTNMAANLAGAMEDDLEGMTLGSLFGKDLLDATAKKYGITGPADGDWDKWGKDHPQEFSNLLVLATALDNANIMNPPAEGYEAAPSTGLVLSFSSYYAFAAVCPEFSPVLTQYLDAMNNGTKTETGEDGETREYTEIVSPKGGTTKVYKVENPTDGKNWLAALEAEVAKYENTKGQTYEEYTAAGGGAEEDQAVFMVIMDSLNNVSAEDVSGDLGNSNLFTEGAVKGVYDDFMNAVYALSGGINIGLDLEKGEVAIIFNQNTYKVTDTIG